MLRKDEEKMISRSTKRFYITVLIVTALFGLLAFLGIRYASASLRPIFYGIVIAYLFKPMCNVIDGLLNKLLVKKLEQSKAKKLSHVLSLILTYIIWLTIIYVFLAALLPTIMSSIISFGAGIPSLLSDIIAIVNRIASENEMLSEFFGDALTELGESLTDWYDLIMKNWEQLSQYLHPVATGVWDVVVTSFTFIFNIFVGLIVSVYLLSGRKKLAAQGKLLAQSVFGKKWAEIVLDEFRFADRMFSGYFVGSLTDSAIVGIICYIACLIMKTPYAVFVSVIVTLTNLIPFFGPWIGLFASAVIILTESPIHALSFVIVVWVLQQIDGNILAPKIQGSKTGLSSFWVLFAILLFGGIFGFPGMVIGVPVFAVIYDICGKLMRYCLKRRGDEDVIENYEKEFLDEENSSGIIQQKIKNLREKAMSSDSGEDAPEAPEENTEPPADLPDNHDDESEREKERFKSFKNK